MGSCWECHVGTPTDGFWKLPSTPGLGGLSGSHFTQRTSAALPMGCLYAVSTKPDREEVNTPLSGYAREEVRTDACLLEVLFRLPATGWENLARFWLDLNLFLWLISAYGHWYWFFSLYVEVVYLKHKLMSEIRGLCKERCNGHVVQTWEKRNPKRRCHSARSDRCDQEKWSRRTRLSPALHSSARVLLSVIFT